LAGFSSFSKKNIFPGRFTLAPDNNPESGSLESRLHCLLQPEKAAFIDLKQEHHL
jgi:hypothetical protein